MKRAVLLTIIVALMLLCGCEKKNDLSGWIGDYSFSETANGTTYDYCVSIYEEDGAIVAWVEAVDETLDGAYIMASAAVNGTKSKIDIFIDQYLPYRHGDGSMDGKRPIATSPKSPMAEPQI